MGIFLNLDKESCFAVEFCLRKEKGKPLGQGLTVGRQITYFGPKMGKRLLYPDAPLSLPYKLCTCISPIIDT